MLCKRCEGRSAKLRHGWSKCARKVYCAALLFSPPFSRSACEPEFPLGWLSWFENRSKIALLKVLGPTYWNTLSFLMCFLNHESQAREFRPRGSAGIWRGNLAWEFLVYGKLMLWMFGLREVNVVSRSRSAFMLCIHGCTAAYKFRKLWLSTSVLK